MLSIASADLSTGWMMSWAGARWEVYGGWHEDPAQLQAIIFCGLRQARPGDA